MWRPTCAMSGRSTTPEARAPAKSACLMLSLTIHLVMLVMMSLVYECSAFISCGLLCFTDSCWGFGTTQQVTPDMKVGDRVDASFPDDGPSFGFVATVTVVQHQSLVSQRSRRCLAMFHFLSIHARLEESILSVRRHRLLHLWPLTVSRCRRQSEVLTLIVSLLPGLTVSTGTLTEVSQRSKTGPTCKSFWP